MNNEPPYHPYYLVNKFQNITICKKCKNIGSSLTCHTANCCKHCGGKVVEYGSGKWIPKN